jgi:hypothetical protein
MKERVVFEANVPVTATLAYADGLKVQGRFGDQVMYSLTDGRVMYVPPIVRNRREIPYQLHPRNLRTPNYGAEHGESKLLFCLSLLFLFKHAANREKLGDQGIDRDANLGTTVIEQCLL